MSISIPSEDRIINKYTPTDLNDKSLQNALNLMVVYDNIVDGNYRSKLKGGTTAERPASPEVREIRYNTDINGLEVYTGGTYKWLILCGIWTNATKPITTDIAPGSKGFNLDIAQEEWWDNTSWNIR